MARPKGKKKCRRCKNVKQITSFSKYKGGGRYAKCKLCCLQLHDIRERAKMPVEMLSDIQVLDTIFAASFKDWETSGYTEGSLPPSLNTCDHSLVGTRIGVGDKTADEIVLVCMHPTCMTLWRTHLVGDYPTGIAQVVNRADEYYSRAKITKG